MRRMILAAATSSALTVATLALACLVSACGSVEGEDASRNRTFSSVGELVATSTLVVKGEVVEVERGEAVPPTDGTAAEVVPRLLVVEVQEALYNRAGASQMPEILRVTNGCWEDGVRHAPESTAWVEPGQVGYFLVSRDRAPDGTLMPTYSPLAGDGLALVNDERIDIAPDGVWRELEASATPRKFREVLDEGIDAAQSGAASAVTSTICYPSDPNDENSMPICVKE